MPTVTIGSPFAGQDVLPGRLVVTGTATGRGGAEPVGIVSVTVNGVSATLMHPPPQPSAGFSATITVAGGGAVTITARATDDNGTSAAASISVNVSGSLPIWPGQPMSNWPVTQSVTPLFQCGPRSLQDIVGIVRAAETAGKKVHAVGTTYSFSDCWLTPDYLVDTSALNKPIQTVQQALLPGAPQHVYHVEAGIKIWKLYQNLNAIGLALETMGGASGQSLAGAVSTGTHGGDYLMAPLADSVLAIHLVGTGGTQYWIEPATSAITSPEAVRAFVAPEVVPQNIIYDDRTFNACLVSLGCMGIIYAIVLRARSSYDLVETTVESTWNAFVNDAPAMLSDRSKRFLQVAIDPYADSSGNNKCIVTTRTEASPTAPGLRPSGDAAQAVKDMIGSMDVDDQLKLLAAGITDIQNAPMPDAQKFAKIAELVLTQTPDQQHVMAEHYWDVLLAVWPAAGFRGSSFSVMDTTFGKPPISGDFPSYSIELFFPANVAAGKLGFVDFVNAALGKINAATSSFLVGYFSLRFTGATRAFLGMQQWDPTCAVEISAIQGVQGELQVLRDILNLVYAFGGVPHWGQLIDLDLKGTGSLYRGYPEWRQVYGRLSSNFAVRTFETDLSSRWSLTSPISLTSEHIHQLYYSQALNTWVDQDLTDAAKGAFVAAASGISSFAIADGQHVYYLGTDQHIHQLYYNSVSNAWVDQDLTNASKGVSAASWTGISSFAIADGQHAFFVGADQHTHQLYYNSASNAWVDQDLTSASNGAAAASGSGISSFAIADGQHVFFVGADQHIHQLYYNAAPNAWSDQDLTGSTKGAFVASASGVSSFAIPDGQHVYYVVR